METEKAYLYTIKCPITKMVVYVGLTLDFNRRKSMHLSSNKGKSPIQNFIRQLRNEYRLPIIEVYKEVPAKDRWGYEMDLIKELISKDTLLLNVHCNVSCHRAIEKYIKRIA